jgi:hypothetical protein
MAINRPRCPDCETPEGELHALFCTRERCPFCGGQLSSCGCISDVLALTAEEIESHAEYIDDSVEPLLGIMRRWEEALGREGRVPYIEYPNACARCRMPWPESFRAPDSEWERYVQIDMRKTVICRPCFDEIKRLIDSHR